jgi:hypothetical protein
MPGSDLRGWRVMATRALAAAFLFCLAGCSQEDDSDQAGLDSTLHRPTSLPECGSLAYAPCDVLDPACQSAWLELARCVRGGDTASGVTPEIRVLSEADALAEQLASYGDEPPDNRFERALVLFGLTQPSSFAPEVAAARFAAETAAFYRREQKDITLIVHAEPGDELLLNGTLLHEFLHALQDAEHDLDSLYEPRYTTDSRLALGSMIEGEARLHQRRVLAALFGLDLASLDFERSFENAREATEEWLFERPELYFSSFSSVPYSHGSDYVHRRFQSEGQAGVRALLEAAPDNMHEILSELWQRTTASAPGALLVPEIPEGEPASIEITTSLGSWMLYAFLHPHMTVEAARGFALAWRDDMFNVLSSDPEQIIGHWQITLDEARAISLQSVAERAPGVRARRSGATVTLVSASGIIPPWLLDP